MITLGRLDGKNVVTCDNTFEWARWFETADRIIARTKVGEATVSTVFLGIDHGFGGSQDWFETMIFGGPRNEEMHKYATWEEAERGHMDIVASMMGKNKTRKGL